MSEPPVIVPDAPVTPEPPVIVPETPVTPEPPFILPDAPVVPEPSVDVPGCSGALLDDILPEAPVAPPEPPEPVVELPGPIPESPIVDLNGFTVPLAESDAPKTAIFVSSRSSAPETPAFVPESAAAAPEAPAFVPESAVAAPEAPAFVRESPSIVLPDTASLPTFVPEVPVSAPEVPVQPSALQQAGKKKSGRGVLRGIGTALLTIPLLAFTVLTLLLTVIYLTYRAGPTFLALPSGVSDVIGSLYPVIISGVLAALFLMFIVWMNIHRIRRAFLAVGVSSLILGVLCIVAGLMPADVLSLPRIILDASSLDSAARHLRDLALPASVGTLLLGAVTLSVYFGIRAIKKDDE